MEHIEENDVNTSHKFCKWSGVEKSVRGQYTQPSELSTVVIAIAKIVPPKHRGAGRYSLQ